MGVERSKGFFFFALIFEGVAPSLSRSAIVRNTQLIQIFDEYWFAQNI